MSQPTRVSLRRGRPALPAGRCRCRRVVTFLTDGEYNALHALAEEKEQSLSAICHRLLSDALTNESKSID